MKEVKELSWGCYRVEVSMLKCSKESIVIKSDFIVSEYQGRDKGERIFVINMERIAPSNGVLPQLGQELYPIELCVSLNGEIVGVKNWRDSLRRVKRVLNRYESMLDHDKVCRYLKKSLSSIDSEEEYISMLMRNTFFQIMFLNNVGGDRIHIVYDYPHYGDNVPFVYETNPTKVSEDYQLYRARLGRISAYNRYNYSGVGQFRYRFGGDFLPTNVIASFLFEADEIGFYKKEVRITKL